MTTLFINGKFTAQSMTGVQRTAHETVLAIDRLLGRGHRWDGERCVLLCPPGGRPPALQHVQVRTAAPAAGSLLLWEQAVLPWAARHGWLANLSGSAPWLAARRSICSLHDAAVFDYPDSFTPAFRSWYRLLFRHLARRAGGLMTVSEFSRQRLGEALRLAPGRMHVVHNGADHFARIEADASVLGGYGLRPGRFLLVVGTAKRTKNIAAVLEAWRQLPRQPDQRLVWVGGMNSRVFAEPPAGAQAQAQAEDVAAGIYRIGVVPDAQLKALYEHAAGLIVASTYEGFGFPAVEAMACGCAVAASSMASLPEVCGDAALYFEPGDRASLCRAMQALLDDEPQRRAAAGRGRVRAEVFPWDAAARALLGHFGELIAAPVPAR